MGITLKQASTMIGITEDEVMELVSAGKLKAERKGNRLRIDESGLGALLASNPGAGPSRTVLERIAALEKEISEKFALLDENRRLVEELRRKDRDIAFKDSEIEKLKRDLVYQKRLLEKEIEDRMRVLDEKGALMDREVSERIARERDEFERRLALERSTWSERLAKEQEKFAASLAEMRTKEGFWSRLVKMLTWS